MILEENQVSILNPMSISETLAGLKKRGYQLKFRREATCIYSVELNHWITPDSFIVDEYYHFEDSSNIDRDRTLYAISSTQGLKGFLADTCFAYEDNISPEMLQKLNPEYILSGELLIQ
jgi:hypothetical protein